MNDGIRRKVELRGAGAGEPITAPALVHPTPLSRQQLTAGETLDPFPGASASVELPVVASDAFAGHTRHQARQPGLVLPARA